jgi:hypothetical protein
MSDNEVHASIMRARTRMSDMRQAAWQFLFWDDYINRRDRALIWELRDTIDFELLGDE